MTLMGTLDAFALPEVLQLLAGTHKTGALHVRRQQLHGVLYLRDGAVIGARADVARQALARRLVGAGVVDDDVLADAVAAALDDPTCGLAAALAGHRRLDPEALRTVATEQVVDAVFDLLRWSDGGFEFATGEIDPDDLGACVAVEDVVAEGRRRLVRWPALTAAVPSPAAVVSLVTPPAQEPVVSREEWALLSLIDGARTVAELVGLSGRGEYALVSGLAGLVERGLLSVGEPASVVLAQRQQLLGALEAAAGGAEPSSRPAGPAVEPVLPAARAAEPSPPPPLSPLPLSSPHPTPEPPELVRDPRVTQDLLVRLIAGVRGL